MDIRFLGIAWPSPVTVDLLLCNLKLNIFEEIPGPIQIEYFFFPSCVYLIENCVQIWVSIFAMFAV